MCYTYYVMFSDLFITANSCTVLTVCYMFLHAPFIMVHYMYGLNIEINPLIENAPNNTMHFMVQKVQQRFYIDSDLYRHQSKMKKNITLTFMLISPSGTM